MPKIQSLTNRLNATAVKHLLVACLPIALLLSVTLIVALSSNNSPRYFSVLGPVDFVRREGQPKTISYTFRVANPRATNYQLKIYNGGQWRQFERVSSGVITLNGVKVVKPTDFGQNVEKILKPIQLASDNWLKVELRSRPGAGITIIVFGEDNEAPVIVSAVNPVPNAAGWNNTNVDVSFRCTDAISGVASCPPPATTSTEGASQIISGTATDRAGNSATTSVTLDIDRTPPLANVILEPLANANGWNNTNTTLRLAATDALSGIANITPPILVTNEGDQQFSPTATDRAGNTLVAPTRVRLDRTSPILSIAAPVPGTITNISSVNITGSSTDNLSGVAFVNCNGVNAAFSGSAFTCLQELSEGPNHINVIATDRAGNTSTTSVTVTRQNPTNGPSIHSITPAGASFGDLVTVDGERFGTNPGAVRVRFSFTSPQGESLVIDQPAFEVAEQQLTVAIPLAVPERTNEVRIVVGSEVSAAVPYDVGPLPWDPTPALAGNETQAYLADIDELLRRADVKLDSWFGETNALPAAEVARLHGTFAQMRDALRRSRDDLALQNPQTLNLLDLLVSSGVCQRSRERLAEAIANLDGSPLGSIMCEGTGLRDVLEDILQVLEVVTTVIDVIVTTVTAACTAATIAAIFSLGIASPLAALICGGAVAVAIEVLRTINDILEASATALRAIARAAPTDPVPNTYQIDVRHPLWIAAPDFIYVGGQTPGQVRAFNDFHNAQCLPDGCEESFTVHVFEIPIPISITVPYTRVERLPLFNDLAFPNGPSGEAGFVNVPGGAQGVTLFTGRDTAGPMWERGSHDLSVSSPCGTRRRLGPVTRSFPLVTGPRLTSVAPSSGQLGSLLQLQVEFLPPSALNVTSADFGDSTVTPFSCGANCLGLSVPDTRGESGVRLFVDGRPSDTTLPFTVLPPVLSSIAPTRVFSGERVELHGTGFAGSLQNNHLTVGGQTALLVARTSFGLVFEAPSSSPGDVQLTAVGAHVSNTLELGTMSWSDTPVRLSHPDRDAAKPALAVMPSGAAGVLWIDRHRDGGAVRLLFADATPGNSAFRVPITITEDLSGLTSAPQQADLGAGLDGRFHVVWTNTLGEIRLASFAIGSSPTADVLVASPPSGYTYRDPTIAVMTDNSVHVAAEGIALNGDYTNHLLHHLRSDDGGATFGPAEDVVSPGRHVGDVDLTFANNRLWRTFTQAIPAGQTPESRAVFTQSSADGLSWTTPSLATEHASYSQIHQSPSVSGDAGGAFVAWTSPVTAMLGSFPFTTSYATRLVAVAGEPYGTQGVVPLIPVPSGNNFYQNDGGSPSLVNDPFSGVAVAWIERSPGSSPDFVNGVPRLQFNRSLDRMQSLTFAPNQTPTVVAGDQLTVDASPSLAIDGNHNFHLVWLAGAAGNRVVRYKTTAPVLYSDSVADNPPQVPAPARDLIAINLGFDYQPTFAEILLVDADRPRELRWIGLSEFGAGARPTFRPGSASLLYFGQGGMRGLMLSDLADGLSLFASDVPGTSDRMMDFTNPQWMPDGRVLVGGRLGGFWSSDANSGHFTRVLASGTDARLSPTSDNLAWVQAGLQGSSVAVRSLNGAPGDERVFLNGIQPNWSPVANRVVFVEQQLINSTFPVGPSTLMEYTPGATDAVVRLVSPDPLGEMRRPVYSPDGQDIAFQYRSDANSTWTIRFASGLSVPAEPGAHDESPVWSPDGLEVAFVRRSLNGRQLVVWRIGEPTVRQLTDLPAFIPLGGAGIFTGGPVWARIPQ